MDGFFTEKTSYVIVLHGVKIENLSHQVVRRARQQTIKYQTPPKRFITPKLHPTSTNLLCWHCSLPCKGVPKFIPRRLRSEWFHEDILRALEEHFLDYGVISEHIYSENFSPAMRGADNLKQLEICDAEGVFCEWSCATAFAIDNLGSNAKDALEAILIVESKFTGVKRVCCHPTPARWQRREYCGEHGMSEAEFRTVLDTLRE